MISAASRFIMMPSLSVDQGFESSLKKEAPALSSHANAYEPSSRPPTNHLNPTGTSNTLRPICAETLSIIALLSRVFPTRPSSVHPDFSIFIDRHKTKSRIEGTVHNFYRNAILFSD